MLRSSVAAHKADHLEGLLCGLDGVHRIVRQPDVDEEAAVIFVADVEPASADRLVEGIAELGIPVDDFLLSKIEVVAPLRRQLGSKDGIEGFAWVEVMGQARANSRPLARYLVMIAVAAVIAALGVLVSSSILIVGAMAVSPDLLPICATCVGIVGRRRRLAERSFVTLVLGLTLVVAVAMVLSALLNWGGFLPDDYRVEESALSTFAHVDYSTVLVALAAGVAAMLAFETRAGAAVGVAISVTTMPASAYLGVAIGAGGIDNAGGAGVVLAINVVLLIFSGSLTLYVQRWLANRSHRAHERLGRG